MTTQQLAEAVLQGRKMTTGEWRSSIAKKTEIENEVTKEMEVSKAIVHQVELLDPKTATTMPYEWREVVDEKFDTDKYNASPRPFAKGDRVAFEIHSFGWSDRRKRHLGKGPVFDLDTTPHKK